MKKASFPSDTFLRTHSPFSFASHILPSSSKNTFIGLNLKASRKRSLKQLLAEVDMQIEGSRKKEARLICSEAELCRLIHYHMSGEGNYHLQYDEQYLPDQECMIYRIHVSTEPLGRLVPISRVSVKDRKQGLSLLKKLQRENLDSLYVLKKPNRRGRLRKEYLLEKWEPMVYIEKAFMCRHPAEIAHDMALHFQQHQKRHLKQIQVNQSRTAKSMSQAELRRLDIIKQIRKSIKDNPDTDKMTWHYEQVRIANRGRKGYGLRSIMKAWMTRENITHLGR